MMAALRRARLVLLSLTLMAGILGMHVMALAPMDGHGTTAEASAEGVMGGAAHSGTSHENPGHSDHTGPSGGMSAHDHGGPQQPGGCA